MNSQAFAQAIQKNHPRIYQAVKKSVNAGVKQADFTAVCQEHFSSREDAAAAIWLFQYLGGR